ncbi:MAG: helix-turn-helix transcriptional regulator [bacterium]|nr:helix-turn-helix transcriptional regulator [bacterium]
MSDKPEKNTIPKTIAYIWQMEAMFITKFLNTEIHLHHAFHIIIALNGSFTLKTENAEDEYTAVLIDSDVEHQFIGGDCWCAILLVDPELEIVEKIKEKFLKEKPVCRLSEEFMAPYIQKLIPYITTIYSAAQAKEVFYHILYSISGHTKAGKDLNPNIQKIFAILKELEIKKISTKELAGRINLSEGRLIHLFKEEVGIPIRRYLLWMRLFDAFESIVNDYSITDAAYEAGFADSAHLSRTFKQMFGLKLSDFSKNGIKSRFIQVIFDKK